MHAIFSSIFGGFPWKYQVTYPIVILLSDSSRWNPDLPSSLEWIVFLSKRNSLEKRKSRWERKIVITCFLQLKTGWCNFNEAVKHFGNSASQLTGGFRWEIDKRESGRHLPWKILDPPPAVNGDRSRAMPDLCKILLECEELAPSSHGSLLAKYQAFLLVLSFI